MTLVFGLEGQEGCKVAANIFHGFDCVNELDCTVKCICIFRGNIVELLLFFSQQSKLREVERKISLENVHNEELMLELALKKKAPTAASTTATTIPTNNQVLTNNVLNQQDLLISGSFPGEDSSSSIVNLANFTGGVGGGIVTSSTSNLTQLLAASELRRGTTNILYHIYLIVDHHL